MTSDPQGQAPAEAAQVLVDVADGVAVLRLNRPDRLNAFTPVMRVELVEALRAADADDAVRAVVVTGAGRGFCAGADLGSSGAAAFSYSGAGMRDGRTETDPDTIGGLPRDGGGVVSLTLAEMTTPVIAAINGAAIGVGITMTLPMDIRVAAESAKFGFVFGRRGIAPEAASSWFLPRVVGISQAAEWALTGRVFGAEEALRGGLVSQVVPDDQVLETALGIAREIAENTSATSVAVTRRMLWSRLASHDVWEAHALETTLLAALKEGPDAQEGVDSFLARRPAHFTATVSEHLPDGVPPWPVRPSTTPSTHQEV